EWTKVSIAALPQISWEGYAFVCRILESKIEIEVTSESLNPVDFTDVYRRALDLASAAVDLVGFKTGAGLTVVLDTMTDSRGRLSQLIGNDKTLGEVCTAYALDFNFGQICEQVLRS